jgi:hypothetical protein
MNCENNGNKILTDYYLFSSSVKIQQYLLIEKLSFILFQIIVQRADLNRRRSLNR